MNGYSKLTPSVHDPFSISAHSAIINQNPGYGDELISEDLGHRIIHTEMDDYPNPEEEISPVSDKENGMSDRTSDYNIQSKYVFIDRCCLFVNIFTWLTWAFENLYYVQWYPTSRCATFKTLCWWPQCAHNESYTVGVFRALWNCG